jgi:pimeloyl-ACP methyl ester carboxylesterase
LNLAFAKTGTGPAVVLLHSLGGDRTSWREEAPRLASTHTVLNVELPGHGASPRPARVDFSEIAREVTRLIRAQQLAPAVVIGHSIGGTLAAWTPVADAAAVRGVLIVDSSVAPAQWSPEELEQWRVSFAKDYPAGLSEFFGPIANGPGQVRRLVESARRVAPDTFLAYPAFAAAHTVAPALAAVNVPIGMFASGLFDAPDRRAVLRSAGYGELRDFQCEWFPRAKHWLQWDEPEAFARCVDAFLGRVEGRP